ncbi:DUF3800 domain-containing protein [Sphingomonas sp. CL5.1]|nr:DUF3800 domain-containing protein [Sphingomonas sp. CL5.1]
MPLPMSFSDFIVYVDESGDHGLRNINREYPVFVLAFCICAKDAYQQTVVPAVQQLKLDFWGHDAVVLHSHEIRKSRGDFAILFDADVRARFIERLNGVMETADFTLIAAVIDKQRLVDRYAMPNDPYEIALGFCMERLQMFLAERGQVDRTTHLLIECRGRAEDDKLELEFRRIRDGDNRVGRMENLSIRFVDKKHNSPGLQLADLVAHPIGRHVIAPEQPNRAYEIVERKFRRNAGGGIDGYGLKVFPRP